MAYPLEEYHTTLFPEEHQESYFAFAVASFMKNSIARYVDEEVRQLILDTATPVPGHTILDIVRNRIDELYQRWHNENDLFDNKKNERIASELTDKYYHIFERLYSIYLAGLGLDTSDQQKIWQHCVDWFLKERWFDRRYTGICFSGYGDDELYPVFTHYQFESFLCGSLKYIHIRKEYGENTAGIFPLAQDDIMKTVISGMHPLSWAKLKEIFHEQMLSRLKQILANVTTVTSDNSYSANEIEQIIRQEFATLKASLEQSLYDTYTSPMLSIVASLPKDELGLMAETLVNITSYMRRVSNISETVGGPTDVAVISKKDGFIWIKRKHYFEPAQNYHFFDDSRITNQSPLLLQELASIMTDIRELLQGEGKNEQEKNK
ncbi:MAG: hypothetical protein JW966_10685 [Anaerolineae bacterium]|nr:hypothetical protein [Anaerolineae bacterium]